MKIVTPGRAQDGTTVYLSRCMHCRCVFEFEEHEAKLKDVRPTPTEMLLVVACPNCGREVWTKK